MEVCQCKTRKPFYINNNKDNMKIGNMSVLSYNVKLAKNRNILERLM